MLLALVRRFKLPKAEQKSGRLPKDLVAVSEFTERVLVPQNKLAHFVREPRSSHDGRGKLGEDGAVEELDCSVQLNERVRQKRSAEDKVAVIDRFCKDAWVELGRQQGDQAASLSRGEGQHTTRDIPEWPGYLTHTEVDFFFAPDALPPLLRGEAVV